MVSPFFQSWERLVDIISPYWAEVHQLKRRRKHRALHEKAKWDEERKEFLESMNTRHDYLFGSITGEKAMIEELAQKLKNKCKRVVDRLKVKPAQGDEDMTEGLETNDTSTDDVALFSSVGQVNEEDPSAHFDFVEPIVNEDVDNHVLDPWKRRKALGDYKHPELLVMPPLKLPLNPDQDKRVLKKQIKQRIPQTDAFFLEAARPPKLKRNKTNSKSSSDQSLTTAATTATRSSSFPLKKSAKEGQIININGETEQVETETENNFVLEETSIDTNQRLAQVGIGNPELTWTKEELEYFLATGGFGGGNAAKFNRWNPAKVDEELRALKGSCVDGREKLYTQIHKPTDDHTSIVIHTLIKYMQKHKYKPMMNTKKEEKDHEEEEEYDKIKMQKKKKKKEVNQKRRGSTGRTTAKKQSFSNDDNNFHNDSFGDSDEIHNIYNINQYTSINSKKSKANINFNQGNNSNLNKVYTNNTTELYKIFGENLFQKYPICYENLEALSSNYQPIESKTLSEEKEKEKETKHFNREENQNKNEQLDETSKLSKVLIDSITGSLIDASQYECNTSLKQLNHLYKQVKKAKKRLSSEYSPLVVTLEIYDPSLQCYVLRGQAAYLNTDVPVSKLLEKLTIQAAHKDGRFFPLMTIDPDLLFHLKITVTSIVNLEVMQTIDDLDMGVHGVILLLTDCTGKEYSGAYLPRILDYLCNGDPQLIIPLLLRKVGYWGMFSAKQIIEMRGVRTELLRFLSLEHSMNLRDFYSEEMIRNSRKSSFSSSSTFSEDNVEEQREGPQEEKGKKESGKKERKRSRPTSKEKRSEQGREQSLALSVLESVEEEADNNNNNNINNNLINLEPTEGERETLDEEKKNEFGCISYEEFDAFLEKDIYHFQYSRHPHGRGVACKGHFK